MTPPDPTRTVARGGDLRDHDVGRGARDVRQIVVLGDPKRYSQAGRRGARDRGCCAKPVRRVLQVVTGERSRTESGGMVTIAACGKRDDQGAILTAVPYR